VVPDIEDNNAEHFQWLRILIDTGYFPGAFRLVFPLRFINSSFIGCFTLCFCLIATE